MLWAVLGGVGVGSWQKNGGAILKRTTGASWAGL